MDAKTAAAIRRLQENKYLAARIMRSGDGKKLLDLLTRGDGGAALDRAAASAAKGDTAELSRLLQGVMNTPEGAAAMSRLNDTARK